VSGVTGMIKLIVMPAEGRMEIRRMNSKELVEQAG
jgi:hypothetical protein